MTEVPKEWNGTPEEWNAVVEAFGRIAKAIQKAGRQIVNSFLRQQLTAANTDKSNNWRRLHGLCTRRKYKKHAKKN